jgi:hypothetical protein
VNTHKETRVKIGVMTWGWCMMHLASGMRGSVSSDANTMTERDKDDVRGISNRVLSFDVEYIIKKILR